ncbi:Fic family protein [Candidatus Gracilibacteria bacterium]|nr:MAG: Fic family protein [Candidatus Gracilibacteria bacterium]
MLLKKIEKPDLSVISKERINFIENNLSDIYYKNNLHKYSDEKYLYWDKIKFKEIPKELRSSEELWFVIKSMRLLNTQTIIKSEDNKYFKMGKPNFLEEFLYKLDLSLRGDFFGIELSKKEKQIFFQNGIIEEAISSSQIEGAMTASNQAKDMIQKDKKPMSVDEKMIMNNYIAMNFVKDELVKEKLTKESLLELQAILTKGILKNNSESGRFRTNNDKIVIQDILTGDIYHKAPNEKFLMEELEKLINYANDEDKGVFTHPFIKACILHFWIGYLHPFCDGNGRTARAVFYWYLLKKGYLGFSFIPISNIIKDSKIQYKNAYIYSEQDDNDLTYFLVYLANSTKKAFKEYEKYILEKAKEKKSYDFKHLDLNERQEKLLIYFSKSPDGFTTTTSHMNYYQVSKLTAIKDLKHLENMGILKSKKVGRFVRYFKSDAFEDILNLK